MIAPRLGTALVAALDDDTLAQLAERLSPFLDASRKDASLLTAAQAAGRLGLHPKTVVRMARDGRLPAVKIGTGWRFDPDQLVVAWPARPQRPHTGRSRPRARTGGVPPSVLAIRGENPNHRGET
jgi:excisionase family DNA binding protein